jgi:hypothetical protein
MDPYQILGVPRDCTRQRVKEAFRARARIAHPDRGGDIPAFIQLRKAYEQILADLDRSPSSIKGVPSGAARRDSAPGPPGPPPVPDFEWIEEVQVRDRPTSAPDASWEPDFVILDEPLPRIRSPRPLEPGWAPDLVLLDDEPGGDQEALEQDLPRERPPFLAFVERLWGNSSPEGPPPSPSPWGIRGKLLVLAAIGLAILVLVWIIWPDDAPSDSGAGSLEVQSGPSATDSR